MNATARMLPGLVLLAALGLGADASAHGCRYYGPGRPPPLGGGGPGAPGGAGGGTGAGAGGVTPGGGGGGAFAGPGGPRGGGPGSYNGPGTGWGWTSGNVPYLSDLSSGAPFGGMDPTEWSLFWHVNAAPWIDVKRAIATTGVQTGSDDWFIGRGERAADREPALRPTRAEIDELVVPALLQALEPGDKRGDESTDLVTGALIALAKLGGASEHRPAIERALLARIPHGNQEVAETATLALGILGGHQALSTLRGLALDTDAGRKLVERSSVRTRTRAFAVYGLALTGRASAEPFVRRAVVHDLIELASAPEAALPDVHVAALIGLGLVPLENESNGDAARLDGSTQAGFLLELARDRRRHVGLRAHAVGSLARLADHLDDERLRETRTLLHEALRERSKERDLVRQACVVAAGELVELDGASESDRQDEDAALAAKTVDALLALADDGDVLSRRFAWIALGRIAGRAPGGTNDEARVRRAFVEALKRSGANRERPWVALGAGLLQRERLERDGSVDRELAGLLRASLGDARAPTDAAAYACAVGLARDSRAEDALLSVLSRFADDDARGHAAVALGLVDGTRPRDALRELVDEGAARPDLVRRAATGLALMGDKSVVPVLVERLATSATLSGQAAYAVALGAAGDRRALEPLLELLADEDVTGSARGFAAVALGSVADPRRLPWNACIAEHMNYVAATDTLSNERGTGVLDIL